MMLLVPPWNFGALVLLASYYHFVCHLSIVYTSTTRPESI